MSTAIHTSRARNAIPLSDNNEVIINKLINALLSSSYRCTWVSYYFDRPEVGLFGIADLHRWSATSDAVLARDLLEYLKIRGGRPVFEDITPPKQKDSQMEYLVIGENGDVRFENVPTTGQAKSGQTTGQVGVVSSAVDCLILGKKAVYDFVSRLYKSASDDNDPHLTDYLKHNYLEPLANENRKLGVLKSQVEVACSESGAGVGIYHVNKDIEKHLFEFITMNKLARPDKWSLFF